MSFLIKEYLLFCRISLDKVVTSNLFSFLTFARIQALGQTQVFIAVPLTRRSLDINKYVAPHLYAKPNFSLLSPKVENYSIGRTCTKELNFSVGCE